MCDPLDGAIDIEAAHGTMERFIHDFVPINPPLRDGQRVMCCRCNAWCGEADQPFADMKGEPFKSFYCQPCAHDVGFW